MDHRVVKKDGDPNTSSTFPFGLRPSPCCFSQLVDSAKMAQLSYCREIKTGPISKTSVGDSLSCLPW